jgi:hypothetical protein
MPAAVSNAKAKSHLRPSFTRSLAKLNFPSFLWQSLEGVQDSGQRLVIGARIERSIFTECEGMTGQHWRTDPTDLRDRSAESRGSRAPFFSPPHPPPHAAIPQYRRENHSSTLPTATFTTRPNVPDLNLDSENSNIIRKTYRGFLSALRASKKELSLLSRWRCNGQFRGKNSIISCDSSCARNKLEPWNDSLRSIKSLFRGFQSPP